MAHLQGFSPNGKAPRDIYVWHDQHDSQKVWVSNENPSSTSGWSIQVDKTAFANLIAQASAECSYCNVPITAARPNLNTDRESPDFLGNVDFSRFYPKLSIKSQASIRVLRDLYVEWNPFYEGNREEYKLFTDNVGHFLSTLLSEVSRNKQENRRDIDDALETLATQFRGLPQSAFIHKSLDYMYLVGMQIPSVFNYKPVNLPIS